MHGQEGEAARRRREGGEAGATSRCASVVWKSPRRCCRPRDRATPVGWRRGAWAGARAGAPAAGSGWTGDRRRRCSYPGDGARDRRAGVRRGRKPSPSTGECPCCVDPSAQPFDWSLEPSGDTPRVTQSAAVCRHIPVAVWRRSNGSFAPHDRSHANPPASARAISNSDICPVFFRRISPGRMLSGAILHCRPERGRLSLVRRNPQASCTGTARSALAWLWRAWTGWSRAGRCRDERVDNW